MLRILLSLLLSLFALQSIAQQETKAKVHLTNGDVISGVLVEYYRAITLPSAPLETTW